MQMKIVNKLLQSISNIPRIFADLTIVIEYEGRVQFVENVEEQTRLGGEKPEPRH